jgi:hypothetical protein
MRKSMRDKNCLLALDEHGTGQGQTGLPRESSHREEMEQTGFTPGEVKPVWIGPLMNNDLFYLYY